MNRTIQLLIEPLLWSCLFIAFCFSVDAKPFSKAPSQIQKKSKKTKNKYCKSPACRKNFFKDEWVSERTLVKEMQNGSSLVVDVYPPAMGGPEDEDLEPKTAANE